TGHGEQALASLAFDSDQLRSKITAQLWTVEQEGVEIGQQIKQMEFPGHAARNPEQRFGLRVQVAYFAVGLSHQNALFDGAQGTGGLAQRTAGFAIQALQAALLAL